MEAAIRSSFAEAAVSVLKEVGFPEVAVREDAGNADERTDIVAAVGLVGDLKGHFVIRIGSVSAHAFVERLSGHLGMEGEDPGDPHYRKAVLGEIANQMSGHASAALSRKGIECMITPPTVISGSGVEAAMPESGDRDLFKVSGAFGSFLCSVALKAGKSI